MPVLSRFRRRFQHYERATSARVEAVDGAPDPAAVRVTAHALTADALRQRAATVAAGWRSLPGESDEAGLDRHQNPGGVAFQTSVANVLDHVLLHAAHHRGQACAAFRAAGATPPNLDVIPWVRAHS